MDLVLGLGLATGFELYDTIDLSVVLVRLDMLEDGRVLDALVAGDLGVVRVGGTA